MNKIERENFLNSSLREHYKSNDPDRNWWVSIDDNNPKVIILHLYRENGLSASQIAKYLFKIDKSATAVHWKGGGYYFPRKN